MLHRRYLAFTFDAITLGLRACILSTVFSLVYVRYHHHNLDYILAVIGVFVVAIIETIALNSPISQRIKYGLIISIVAGIATALGSISGASSVILLSAGIIFFMCLVGLSTSAQVLPASAILFIADLFIVGSGMPASAPQALSYGIYFCNGGLSLVALGYLQHQFYSRKKQIKTHSIHITKHNFFTLSRENIQFAIKLSIAACCANLIAGYFKLSQQYCAPMTALLILKADHDLLLKRVHHRLSGTLLGSIFAGGLIFFIQNQIFLAVLMFPIMFFIVISLAKHYGAYVFFLTIMISMLFNLIAYHGLYTTWERIVSTLLGIVVVIVTVYFSRFVENKLLKI